MGNFTSKFSIRHFQINILLPAVFVVSLSTLAFEVLLTRVFSIGQWNHLSFMVISIALFGFAASGTFLSMVDFRKKVWLQKIHSRNGLAGVLCLYSMSAILAFMVLNHLPLDYFRLAVEPIQLLYLSIAYLMLSLPFFFAGMLISTAYIAVPEKTGMVYFASMAGSGLGAGAPVFLLPYTGEGKLILISALVPLLPAILASTSTWINRKSESDDQSRWRWVPIAGGFTCIAAALCMADPAGWNLTRVIPSPYKALSQIMQFPNTRIVETHSSIRGRIDRIKTPYLRYAPGLSLKYTDAMPGQNAFFKDADNQFVLYDIKDPGQVRFAVFLLSYGAYFLHRGPDDILLITAGGGSSIPCAVASGADRISLVEPSPQIAGILKKRYRHNIVNENPRAFLTRDGSDYDIIHVENWGTSIPGANSLNQEHLFTVEAFGEYIKRLKPDGLLTLSRKLLLPPSDSLRLWGAAFEALKRAGVDNPAEHLAVLRNFDTFSLIVSKAIIDPGRLSEFAKTRNFDLVFLRGMPRKAANRFNQFDEPYHFSEINRLAKMYRAGRQKVFFQDYFLDVVPQSDKRPFPGRFLKWSKVDLLFHSLGQRLYALFMSGEIVVAVVFVEALLIALVLLVIPLWISTRGMQKPNLAPSTYFFAVGAGFMLVELFFIKRFIILVGDPVISFTLVLAGFLFFSGLGGFWSYRYQLRNLRLPLALLILVLVLETIVIEWLMPFILSASTAGRYGVILLLLLPVGFLMGLPFPLGMRYLLHTPVQRAYAWSINGCASVLSAIAAAQIAISWGIPAIAATGVIAYMIALASIKSERGRKV